MSYARSHAEVDSTVAESPDTLNADIMMAVGLRHREVVENVRQCLKVLVGFMELCCYSEAFALWLVSWGEATRTAQKFCKRIACKNEFIFFTASPVRNAQAPLGTCGSCLWRRFKAKPKCSDWIGLKRHSDFSHSASHRPGP